MSINYTVTERFLKYVQIDTQSDPNANTCPSTEKQKNLGALLVKELLQMGVYDAHMDALGYVYATIPANSNKNIPVICFCSHIDTSPDCSGEQVKPIIHRNYRGGNIVLPNDQTQVIQPTEHPSLQKQIGNDIITTDGTTLLGADDKAGLAEIMDAVNHLMKHPEIKHGTIKVLFTPDEEIGRGADRVDLKKLGADYAYTVDGEEVGHIENETFSADAVSIHIRGVGTHPGFAKNRMESALKAAAEIISSLPKKQMSPETTEKKEGFIHPGNVSGNVEEAKIDFIIRGFEEETLLKQETLLKNLTTSIMKNYQNSTFEFVVKEQYRNMKTILDEHPHVVDYAMQATKRAGVTPLLSSIRGGTDGSRLSFMGLPCPNIFAGGHAFHSKQEWVSIQDMQKVVDTIVQLCMIWEENC